MSFILLYAGAMMCSAMEPAPAPDPLPAPDLPPTDHPRALHIFLARSLLCGLWILARRKVYTAVNFKIILFRTWLKRK